MKLIFKIDRHYDEEMLLEFLPTNEIKKNIDDFAKILRIDREDLQKKIKKYSSNINKIVAATVKEKFAKILPYMKNSVHSYQKYWNNINDDFFALVTKKTGAPWKHKTYYCVVSAFHEGISSWGKNTVARIWSVNPDTQRPVTAHEIVLSHFWTMLENDPLSQKWDDNKKWQYSEIFSWCLLGLNDEFVQFWPWLLEEHRWPLHHEYPEIIPLQKKLVVLHKKYKNFNQFFVASLQLEKNRGTK